MGSNRNSPAVLTGATSIFPSSDRKYSSRPDVAQIGLTPPTAEIETLRSAWGDVAPHTPKSAASLDWGASHLASGENVALPSHDLLPRNGRAVPMTGCD